MTTHANISITRLRKKTCCIRGISEPEILTIVAMPTKDADDSIIENMAFKLYFCDIMLMLFLIMGLLYNIVFILQALRLGCIITVLIYKKEKLE